jgi:hypothetical protein
MHERSSILTDEVFESISERYEMLAEELDTAAEHARVAARHFREREVPRGCAHAFAAQGHLSAAQNLMDELALLHARKSTPRI